MSLTPEAMTYFLSITRPNWYLISIFGLIARQHYDTKETIKSSDIHHHYVMYVQRLGRRLARRYLSPRKDFRCVFFSHNKEHEGHGVFQFLPIYCWCIPWMVCAFVVLRLVRVDVRGLELFEWNAQGWDRAVFFRATKSHLQTERLDTQNGQDCNLLFQVDVRLLHATIVDSRSSDSFCWNESELFSNKTCFDVQVVQKGSLVQANTSIACCLRKMRFRFFSFFSEQMGWLPSVLNERGGYLFPIVNGSLSGCQELFTIVGVESSWPTLGKPTLGSLPNYFLLKCVAVWIRSWVWVLLQNYEKKKTLRKENPRKTTQWSIKREHGRKMSSKGWQRNADKDTRKVKSLGKF